VKRQYLILSVLIAAIAAVIMLSSPRILNKSRRGKTIGEKMDSYTLSAGDFLSDRLAENGVPETIVYPVIKIFSETFDLRSCRAGNRYDIGWLGNNEFAYFRYWTHPTEFYTVRRVSADSYTLKKEKLELKKSIMGADGSIETSLWEAMQAQGIPGELIVKLTDIFAWQVDFLTEPRKGDTYKLVWERYEGENGLAINGKILGAMYRGKESGINLAFYFEGRCYDQSGRSLEKLFLKAPLNYRRISSYFSLRRFHPILKIFRPHFGIDYAAATGTPVVSIGDGAVIFKGWKGGYGNYVSIRHNSIYTSNYGHLSRYGKGIRNGSRVRQGQVIGYVGMTGLATGPHLDFSVKKNGTPVNFLTLKFPPMKNIDKKSKPAFEEVKNTAIKQLAAAKGGAARIE